MESMNSRSTEIYSRSTPTETRVRSTVCLHLSMVCLWFVYGSTVCLLFILDHCAPRIKLLIVAKYKLMSLPGGAYIRRSKKNSVCVHIYIYNIHAYHNDQIYAAIIFIYYQYDHCLVCLFFNFAICMVLHTTEGGLASSFQLGIRCTWCILDAENNKSTINNDTKTNLGCNWAYLWLGKNM
jgi:hypothetical protein